jgi:hypothetical protein
MPLKDYTTTVAVSKTLTEISKHLVRVGARGVSQEYDSRGHLIGLGFAIQLGPEILHYQLPVRTGAVHDVLKRQRVGTRYLTPEHVERVAWRILGDWMAAQAAIIETEMVTLPQIMLPYQMVEPGTTIYDKWEIQHNKILEAGAS